MSEQDSLLGNTIGNCRLDEKLAVGGMGLVYRAYSKRWAKDVAMKILAPSLATDPEYVERFFREANAMSSIDHPNIVKVLDAGKDQDRYFMVMEYVRGQTLGDLIFDKGRLNLDEATRIARDIARGLEAAHSKGIIHRDIKPHNVLMMHDGTPKIIDFGLVRTGSKPSGITMEGVFMGTPEYVSPEQAEGGKIDVRSDLYSLGVAYYQMLSGTLPFFGKTAMEMAMARLREDPRPLESAVPGVDPRAAAVISKLLRKSPNERYATATDLVRDLEAVMVGKPPTALKPQKKGTERHAPVSLDTKRKARAFFFVFLLALGLAAFGALGAITGPAARAQNDYWRGLTVPLNVDASRPGLREALLAAGLLSLVGAFFVFRRELAACGRPLRIVLVILMALVSAYAGVAYVDGAAVADDGVGQILASARAVGSALVRPVHLLLAATTLTILAIGLSWPRDAGSKRYLVFRGMLIAALFLFYAFAVDRDLQAPFRHLTRSGHLTIPALTVAFVAGLFGIELTVAHRWTGGWRLTGLLLFAVGLASALAFGVIGARPEEQIDWASIFRGPFESFAREFRPQAGPVGLAFLFLSIGALLYSDGLARWSRKTG